eukprot:scaffold110016_cov30-Tisochrysis_lutea.AAC.1
MEFGTIRVQQRRRREKGVPEIMRERVLEGERGPSQKLFPETHEEKDQAKGKEESALERGWLRTV